MTKKVNSSLRANGGETHTLKIRIRIWKKKSFICLWLSSLLSVVFQWVLRNQAYIFWAPLVYVWGINSFYGWSLVSPWAYVDGVHLVWCKGILGFLTHLHRFLFFFFSWGSPERGMGSCCQVSWRPAFELSWKMSLLDSLWEGHAEESRSQDSPCKELNPHSNCYKQRGEAPAQAATSGGRSSLRQAPRGSVWGALQAGPGVRAVVSCPQGLLCHWPPLLSAFSQAAVSQPSSLKGRQDDTAALGWHSCLVGTSICHSSEGRILIGPPSSCH